MTIQKLAEKLKVDEKKAESILFHVVDFLIDIEPSDEVVACGSYYNSPLNGDTRMIRSYRELLWAQYEELVGQRPHPPSPTIRFDIVSLESGHVRLGI